MAKVNLDAIIPREDFEAEQSLISGKKKETLSIEDIKSDSFFFSSVRKPDFQRETNEWDAKKIAELLDSFLNDDLIPAIILWRSSAGYIFVIDGSHRLSALAGWINDDYGHGSISKAFYDGIIPEEQISVAEETAKAIRKRIGSYADYKLALTNPEKVAPEIVRRSKNLGALAIQVQWVEGDATKAENSFFKINQQAAPIDKTELVLLESRKKPNCIAARAIIRGGKGHKYWSGFSSNNQEEIQRLASEVHEVLFNPKLQTPIKTLDIPIGGKNYSGQTLPLVLDFVNIVNNISPDFKKTLSDDLTGEATINILKRTRKIAWRINSVHASSLGLHPAVYFYSQEGRHKVASFYAIAALVLQMDKANSFNDFISVRPLFEKFVILYDYLPQQMIRRFRSAFGSHRHIADLYLEVIRLLGQGKSIDEVVNEVLTQENFKYLNLVQENPEVTTGDFSSERKSAVYIKSALQHAPTCKICSGLMHRNSVTIDHIDRREDGGLGAVDNGQIAHPYCNTTFKN